MKHQAHSFRKTARGFTFVEILIYIALSGLFLSAMFPFAMNVSGISAKTDVRRETVSAARVIAEEFVSAIRSAEGIDEGASAFSVDPGRLVLDRIGTSDQLIIDVENEVIRFRSGNDPETVLHGSSVSVKSLVFENRSSDDKTTQHIDFTLIVEYAGAGSGRSEYQSDVTIEGGAELRNNSL